MQQSATVRITAFGQGQFECVLPEDATSIGAALAEHAVETEGRRIAINGNPAGLETPVVQGDEVTVMLIREP